jgi:hypothetical protein
MAVGDPFNFDPFTFTEPTGEPGTGQPAATDIFGGAPISLEQYLRMFGNTAGAGTSGDTSTRSLTDWSNLFGGSLAPLGWQPPTATAGSGAATNPLGAGGGGGPNPNPEYPADVASGNYYIGRELQGNWTPSDGLTNDSALPTGPQYTWNTGDPAAKRIIDALNNPNASNPMLSNEQAQNLFNSSMAAGMFSNPGMAKTFVNQYGQNYIGKQYSPEQSAMLEKYTTDPNGYGQFLNDYPQYATGSQAENFVSQMRAQMPLSATTAWQEVYGQLPGYKSANQYDNVPYYLKQALGQAPGWSQDIGIASNDYQTQAALLSGMGWDPQTGEFSGAGQHPDSSMSMYPALMKMQQEYKAGMGKGTPYTDPLTGTVLGYYDSGGVENTQFWKDAHPTNPQIPGLYSGTADDGGGGGATGPNGSTNNLFDRDAGVKQDAYLNNTLGGNFYGGPPQDSNSPWGGNNNGTSFTAWGGAGQGWGQNSSSSDSNSSGQGFGSSPWGENPWPGVWGK